MRRIAEKWLEGQGRARDLRQKPSKTPDHEDNRSQPIVGIDFRHTSLYVS
jgi:hypothetical protein